MDEVNITHAWPTSVSYRWLSIGTDMCYMLLLSTDAPVDLSQFNSDLINFDRELPGLSQENELSYSYKWYVGSNQGCSCGFRHLSAGSIKLGFGEPEDWYPEDRVDIEATLEFCCVVRKLVGQGYEVECIDAWATGQESSEVLETIEVDFLCIKDTEFRFYDNHKFKFKA